jgi:hypothetical protein
MSPVDLAIQGGMARKLVLLAYPSPNIPVSRPSMLRRFYLRQNS